jgi:ACS family sodium-dependent inorganic phosphate cotransporter-like MFS transporter 9
VYRVLYTIFRACTTAHFCQNNCFFILLSWLPTYFHDNFPDAKSWIFNVVPWVLAIPGIAAANYLTNRLLVRGYHVGTARKTMETICLGTEAVSLLLIGECRLASLI